MEMVNSNKFTDMELLTIEEGDPPSDTESD